MGGESGEEPNAVESVADEMQVNQLPLVERFIAVFNEQPIIAAVRMLPQGIAALATSIVIP